MVCGTLDTFFRAGWWSGVRHGDYYALHVLADGVEMVQGEFVDGGAQGGEGFVCERQVALFARVVEDIEQGVDGNIADTIVRGDCEREAGERRHWGIVIDVGNGWHDSGS